MNPTTSSEPPKKPLLKQAFNRQPKQPEEEKEAEKKEGEGDQSKDGQPVQRVASNNSGLHFELWRDMEK